MLLGTDINDETLLVRARCPLCLPHKRRKCCKGHKQKTV